MSLGAGEEREVIADVIARRVDEALAAGLAAGGGEEQREVERIPELLRRLL